LKQRPIFWLAVLVLILGAAFLAYQLTITAKLKNSPTYQGTQLNGIAPNFQLTDQNGIMARLSDFRGKIVVLTFMDSQCKDVCPLTAAQLREAYKRLNPNEASRVVVLGVNANSNANAIIDISKATEQWHLAEIPSWHFMTGSRVELESVWKAYAIAVMSVSNSITHTSGVYLIDPAGQKRWYISAPSLTEGDPQWIMPLNELLIIHIRELLKEKQ